MPRLDPVVRQGRPLTWISGPSADQRHRARPGRGGAWPRTLHVLLVDRTWRLKLWRTELWRLNPAESQTVVVVMATIRPRPRFAMPVAGVLGAVGRSAGGESCRAPHGRRRRPPPAPAPSPRRRRTPSEDHVGGTTPPRSRSPTPFPARRNPRARARRRRPAPRHCPRANRGVQRRTQRVVPSGHLRVTGCSTSRTGKGTLPAVVPAHGQHRPGHRRLRARHGRRERGHLATRGLSTSTGPQPRGFRRRPPGRPSAAHRLRLELINAVQACAALRVPVDALNGVGRSNGGGRSRRHW